MSGKKEGSSRQRVIFGYGHPKIRHEVAARLIVTRLLSPLSIAMFGVIAHDLVMPAAYPLRLSLPLLPTVLRSGSAIGGLTASASLSLAVSTATRFLQGKPRFFQ